MILIAFIITPPEFERTPRIPASDKNAGQNRSFQDI
jgi:hypothetical protein